MTVETRDVARYMRIGLGAVDSVLAAKIDSLRDIAMREMRPARTWRRVDGWRSDAALRLSGLDLEGSRTLLRHISGCDSLYLACGTLGAGFDALHRRLSAVSGADALVLQALGAAAIEVWMDGVEDEIRRELPAGESLAPRYSPGYGDFPLSAQRGLLALLDAPRTVGVSLTDSLLMVPSKSVSAVIGVRRVEDGR